MTTFKSGINTVVLIETVAELRAALADLNDATPIRFRDPDTGWLMRLSPEIITDVDADYEAKGRMVFKTQEYWMEVEE